MTKELRSSGLLLIPTVATCLVIGQPSSAFEQSICKDAFWMSPILSSAEDFQRNHLYRVREALLAKFTIGLELPKSNLIVIIPDLKSTELGTTPNRVIFPLIESRSDDEIYDPIYLHELGHQLFYYNIEKSFKALDGLRSKIEENQDPSRGDFELLSQLTGDIQEVFADLIAVVYFDSDHSLNYALQKITQLGQPYRAFSSNEKLRISPRPLDPHDSLYDVREKLGECWQEVKADPKRRARFLADVLNVIGENLQIQFSGNGAKESSELKAVRYIKKLDSKFVKTKEAMNGK